MTLDECYDRSLRLDRAETAFVMSKIKPAMRFEDHG
jgi:hypothetical protein